MPQTDQGLSISGATIVTHADGVADGEMDGEVVLMSVANGEYYAMDAIGTRLWKLVATPRSIESVARTLGAEYDGAPVDIERDVLAFVSDLLRRNLLRIAA